jgi:Co/Zn/Cd efflux system component
MRCMMKKKNLDISFFIIFFIAALLVEIYSFIEWREDFISIIGTSIVFLISIYLLIDAIKQKYMLEREQYIKLQEEQHKRIEEAVEGRINKLQVDVFNRQKAVVKVLLQAQQNLTDNIIQNENDNIKKIMNRK